ADLKSAGRKAVGVRASLPALKLLLVSAHVVSQSINRPRLSPHCHPILGARASAQRRQARRRRAARRASRAVDNAGGRSGVPAGGGGGGVPWGGRAEERASWGAAGASIGSCSSVIA